MTCLEILILIEAPRCILWMLPNSVILCGGEWRRSVQEPGTHKPNDLGATQLLYTLFKTDQVAHGADSHVHHEVHAMCMDCINGLPPVI